MLGIIPDISLGSQWVLTVAVPKAGEGSGSASPITGTELTFFWDSGDEILLSQTAQFFANKSIPADLLPFDRLSTLHCPMDNFHAFRRICSSIMESQALIISN